MNQRIRTIFKSICKANDKIINSREKVCSLAFAITKKRIISLPLIIKGSEEKEILKFLFKKFITSQKDLEAYIIILDTYMTIFDKKAEKGVVMDAIIRAVYTPTEKEMIAVPYKDGKILKDKIQKIIGRDKNQRDEWDIWGKGWDETDKQDANINGQYQKFKEENPEKYKEL